MHERIRRGKGMQPAAHELQPNMPLPSRETIMQSSRNKESLISRLCEAESSANILLIGDKECGYGHEEADINIVSYMIETVQNGAKTIQVVADNTDISVLLTYFYCKLNLDVILVMKKRDGKYIGIKKTDDP